MDSLDARIYVAGHHGMVGSAIVRQLQARGHRHILTRTHAQPVEGVEAKILWQGLKPAYRAFLQRESAHVATPGQ